MALLSMAIEEIVRIVPVMANSATEAIEILKNTYPVDCYCKEGKLKTIYEVFTVTVNE